MSTLPLPPRVASLLADLVLARTTPGDWRPGEDDTGRLRDALERAVLDGAYLEAYLAQLLRLWAKKPPAGELLEDEWVPLVRDGGVRAVPADRLARLAVEPTAVLDLRDRIHADALPAYWSARLREWNPRIDHLRDEILEQLAAGVREDVPSDLVGALSGEDADPAGTPPPARWTVPVATPRGEVRVEFSWYAEPRRLDVRLFGAVTLADASGTARLEGPGGAEVDACEADARRFTFRRLAADPRGSNLTLRLEVRPAAGPAVRFEAPV